MCIPSLCDPVHRYVPAVCSPTCVYALSVSYVYCSLRVYVLCLMRMFAEALMAAAHFGPEREQQKECKAQEKGTGGAK